MRFTTLAIILLLIPIAIAESGQDPPSGISTAAGLDWTDPIPTTATIKTLGNVGIGTQTLEPNAKLTVSGSQATVATYATNDPWHLNDYDYREKITITTPESVTAPTEPFNRPAEISGTPVEIFLDSKKLIAAGKMRSDCADIRAIDQQSGNALKYWVEDCGNSKTLVWIKIESHADDTTKEYYLYYGHDQATKEDHANDVFEIFDDFDTLDNTKFSYGDAIGGNNPMIATLDNGLLKIRSDNTWRALRLRKSFTPTNGLFSVRSKLKIGTTQGTKHNLYPNNWVQESDHNRNRFGLFLKYGQELRAYFTRDGTQHTSQPVMTDLEQDTWYKIDSRKYGAGYLNHEILTENNAPLRSYSRNEITYWYDETWAWQIWKKDSNFAYYDWVHVRRTPYYNPTTSHGQEQHISLRYNNLVFDNEKGFLGINEPNPQAQLHIKGDGEAPAVLISAKNELAVPAGQALKAGHWDADKEEFTPALYVGATGSIGINRGPSPFWRFLVRGQGGESGIHVYVNGSHGVYARCKENSDSYCGYFYSDAKSGLYARGKRQSIVGRCTADSDTWCADFRSDGPYGVYGTGTTSGGLFQRVGSGADPYCYIGYSTTHSLLCAGGTKSFITDHPTKPDKKLIHAAIEGPESGLYYRGQATLEDGKAVVTLPEYFEGLARKEDRTIQLTAAGKTPFVLSADPIQEGTFKVYGTKDDGSFYWEVKAIRADIDKLEIEVDKAEFEEGLRKAQQGT